MTEIWQTSRQTDEQTDRRTDVISTLGPTFSFLNNSSKYEILVTVTTQITNHVKTEMTSFPDMCAISNNDQCPI